MTSYLLTVCRHISDGTHGDNTPHPYYPLPARTEPYLPTPTHPYPPAAGLDLKERDCPTFDGQIFKVTRQL